MSDNKKDGFLDYRRMKQTQFDPGQVMRGSFSESASGLRTFGTNAILRDHYTHFVQELDINNRPTTVTYYQAVRPRRDKITFRGDVGGDLAGKYFTIQEPITRKTWVFYYVVSGNGVAPGIGDVEIAIPIVTGDFAAVVAYATKGAIKQLNEFYVVTDDILIANIEFEYAEFGGENQTVDVATSGFFYTNVIQGSSIEVGKIELKYDASGNPIYNGNLLRGLIYNPYTASFDAERSEVEVNIERLTGSTPTIYNIPMPIAGQEYSQVLPIDANRFQMNIRDHKSKYRFSWTSGGPVITKSPGTIYNEEMLELISGQNTIYFSADKDNLIMEIIVWK